MMQHDLPLEIFQEGDVFDDSLAASPEDPGRVYRVVRVRERTVLAENVTGIQRSFGKKHRVRRAEPDLWNRLQGAKEKRAAA